MQRRQRQPPAASSCRRGVRAAAAAGDLGDEYEEMVERRDELLRIREDADLNTDEDEELSALTEREWLGDGACVCTRFVAVCTQALARVLA